MMKYNSIRELVKGTHNDTQIQNISNPQKQYHRVWWDAADQCIMSHGTYIHITI